MRWSRRSRNWTSFSSPLARAWDGHEVVDLAVGRLTISGFDGTGMPRCVLYWEGRSRTVVFRRLGSRAGRIPVSDRGTFGGLSQSVSQFGFAGSTTSL